jgi:hypothetical protein
MVAAREAMWIEATEAASAEVAVRTVAESTMRHRLVSSTRRHAVALVASPQRRDMDGCPVPSLRERRLRLFQRSEAGPQLAACRRWVRLATGSATVVPYNSARRPLVAVSAEAVLLKVDDARRAAEFWTAALGYKADDDAPNFLVPPAGNGVRLHLDERDRTHIWTCGWTARHRISIRRSSV